MMNCVVVDDEPLARECLIDYVEKVDFLHLTGEGTNPMDLSKLLGNNKVDLVFLDIQMPVMNGIDFLKANSNLLPSVVFTTAYPSYALEGYSLDVLDYLLKPITFNRFYQAATKAREFHQLSQSRSEPETAGYFFVRCNAKYEKIYFDEILFVQAMQNYVVIQTKKDKFITLMNLKSMEQKLESSKFIRVHKSYIIPIGKVESIENHELKIGGYKIPISRNYRKEVLDIVLGNKLW